MGPSAQGALVAPLRRFSLPLAPVFHRMTGQPEDSPGFSTMGLNAGRVIARRINLRVDHPNLIKAVLPHEITHVLLADLFPDQQVPRWADEGIAVLSEPPSEQRLRAADLEKPLAAGRLFKVQDLMVMDYPDGQSWGLYYAQSVSLTRFLVEQGTSAQFIQFVQGTLPQPSRSGTTADLPDRRLRRPPESLAGPRTVSRRRCPPSPNPRTRRRPRDAWDLSGNNPNVQVWVADITSVRLRKEFVYLAVMMDVFTRSIRGRHLGHGLERESTIAAVLRAFERGRPEIHHSDQGVQDAATASVELLKESDAQIRMASGGEPRENGSAERLMRTMKEEEVDLSEYEDFADAWRQLGRFLDDGSNRKRIHSALGYLTPGEFERQWIVMQRSQ